MKPDQNKKADKKAEAKEADPKTTEAVTAEAGQEEILELPPANTATPATEPETKQPVQNNNGNGTVTPAPRIIPVTTQAPPEPPELVRTQWRVASKPADKFRHPGLFQTRAQLLYLPQSVPTIYIEKRAITKIHIMLSMIEMEVGWLGTAERDENNFIIKDVFLFGQNVGYGHSELSSESMADTMSEVITKENGEYIFNNTRFWGHSHGNGGTMPSHQDQQQMELFEDFGANFFIRGIFNRKGQFSLSVFDWERNIAYHDTPWYIVGKNVTIGELSHLKRVIGEEMREKVAYYTTVRRKYTKAAPVRSSRSSWNPVTLFNDLFNGGEKE